MPSNNRLQRAVMDLSHLMLLGQRAAAEPGRYEH
jgi:hypothetical protein